MAEAGKDSRFVVVDAAGLNGGMPPAAWSGEYLTSQPRLFTRSHGAIPDIDADSWRLRVTGLVDRSLELSLSDLRTRFAPRDVNAALVCAGLRRRELLAVAPLPGELPWEGQAIANVRWTGVSLHDVLRVVGVAPACRHIVFTGLDQVERQERQFGFGGSIPLEKAADRDVLLAFALDGQPLPPAHGFPLRVVVPGWIRGPQRQMARRDHAERRTVRNYFRTHAYRLQRTADSTNPLSVAGGDVLEEIRLNSMIVTPDGGARVPAGAVAVSGWAIGPNAEAPSRVEVSSDGGRMWVVAAIEPVPDRRTWRLWHTVLQLPRGRHELVVRAWDQAGTTQPESVADTWNVKGYVNNAWHRVSVTAGEAPPTSSAV